MPATRKAAFAWASIAGADPEPVEIIDEQSFTGRGSSERKGVLTTGCQDPFWLDDEAAGIVVYDGNPLNRPSNPETREQRDLREQKYRAKQADVKAAYEWHRTHAKHGPDCAAGDCSGKDKEYTHGWRGAR